MADMQLVALHIGPKKRDNIGMLQNGYSKLEHCINMLPGSVQR